MKKFIKRSRLLLPACRRTERGIALIGVLWLIAILSVLASGMVLLLHNDSLIARDKLDSVRAEGRADAGVFLTLNDLLDPKTVKTIPVDGEPRNLRFAGTDVQVSVQDETGRIDINFTSKELLESVFSSLGVTESSTIADDIGKTRNKKTFQSIDELNSINGISMDLLHRWRSILTVYSQRQMVNTAVAPKQVLDILPGIDDQKMADILSARSKEAPSFGEYQSRQGTEGKCFTITATAQEGRSGFQRRAVVRMSGNKLQPFSIYEWKIAE